MEAKFFLGVCILARGVVTQLWDFGWLFRHDLKFEPCNSPDDLVRSYVASRHFGTSFRPSDKDGSSIHGRFIRERITANDFQRIEIWSPDAWVLEAAQIQERGPLPEDQQAALRAALADALSTGGVPYRLRFTERDTEL